MTYLAYGRQFFVGASFDYLLHLTCVPVLVYSLRRPTLRLSGALPYWLFDTACLLVLMEKNRHADWQMHVSDCLFVYGVLAFAWNSYLLGRKRTDGHPAPMIGLSLVSESIIVYHALIALYYMLA